MLVLCLPVQTTPGPEQPVWLQSMWMRTQRPALKPSASPTRWTRLSASRSPSGERTNPSRSLGKQTSPIVSFLSRHSNMIQNQDNVQGFTRGEVSSWHLLPPALHPLRVPSRCSSTRVISHPPAQNAASPPCSASRGVRGPTVSRPWPLWRAPIPFPFQILQTSSSIWMSAGLSAVQIPKSGKGRMRGKCPHHFSTQGKLFSILCSPP